MQNNKLNIQELLIYRKGLKVERLHTVPHLTPYNNGFHSANGALIAEHLCMANDMELSAVTCMKYMLLHDVAECYVGDVPTNVKMDNSELKSVLDKIETKWESRNVTNMPDLHHTEKAICKVADLAELGMFCVDELNLGNNNVIYVLDNVVDYLQSYTDIKGCNSFIKYFVTKGGISI